MMKRIRAIGITVVVIGAIVMILLRNKAASEAKAKSDVLSAPAVTVAPVATQQLGDTLSLVGTTVATNDVNVVSEAAGRIVAVHVGPGDRVEAGTVLMQINDELKHAAVQTAQANFDKAKKDLERMEYLRKEKSAGDAQYEGAKVMAQQAEAALTVAKRQLADCSVKSPVAGVVTARLFDVGAFVPLNVNLFATPQNDATALNVLALFAQDSYSVKRLTLIGGLRFEQLEGYLPAQSSPPSQFAAAGIGGFAAQPRSYDEVRDVVKWHTAGPRVSAVIDLSGDGKTAAKASAGRYYYVLSTGGGGVTNVNRNGSYAENYTWIDRNGDRRFQIGEQTGTPVVTAVVVNGAILTSIDPNFSRPYTDEYNFGVDRELAANVKLSAVYTYRREQNLQATRNPADNVYATTPTSAVDPGIDGVVGTADDGTYAFYQRISAANNSLITNDPTVVQSYKGLEITLTKRLSNRWQMLAGYTISKNRLDNVSVDTSPNFLINANGNVTTAANADRPNQFKLTGMYLLPFHDVIVSGNFRSQQGPPFTRQISRALAIGGSQTINLEPLGSTRIDTLTTIDLRLGKLFKFGRRSLEASVDFDNLANANTAFNVRTLTPATAFTDPATGTRATLQQFLSPSQIIGPRTVVFRAAFTF